MAKAKKITQTTVPVSYEVTDLLPVYTNNVRIKVTDENVYIDFGFVDAAQDTIDLAKVVSRVIMNRSTFENFSKHAEQSVAARRITAGEVDSVILSRCPVQPDR